MNAAANRKMSFTRKIFLIAFCYGILYFFFVQKMYWATGQWHWNLFDYFGKIQFSIVTIGFFALGLILAGRDSR
jgi:hypothetical protein